MLRGLGDWGQSPLPSMLSVGRLLAIYRSWTLGVSSSFIGTSFIPHFGTISRMISYDFGMHRAGVFLLSSPARLPRRRSPRRPKAGARAMRATVVNRPYLCDRQQACACAIKTVKCFDAFRLVCRAAVSAAMVCANTGGTPALQGGSAMRMRLLDKKGGA